jgi:hypothetical protein
VTFAFGVTKGPDILSRLIATTLPESDDAARSPLMPGRWASGDEWWRPMPPGASADALRVLTARGVRAFGDGFVALLLPIYLVQLGFRGWRLVRS